MFDLTYAASVFFSRKVAKRSFTIATIVGTILAFINHGDVIVSGNLTGTGWIKIIGTYLVPYTVSSVTAVLAALEQRKASADLQLEMN